MQAEQYCCLFPCISPVCVYSASGSVLVKKWTSFLQLEFKMLLIANGDHSDKLESEYVYLHLFIIAELPRGGWWTNHGVYSF